MSLGSENVSFEYIQNNYEEIMCNIDNACRRSNRNPEDVTLIAVSKTKPVEMIEEAILAGMTCFGENKPQEIRDKSILVSRPVQWHMIGNLQSNKIKYVLQTCTLIHSVDSYELAQKIEAECIKKECHINILLQVNISGEDSKGGFSLNELYESLPLYKEFKHVHVQGLMTVPPFVHDSEENRPIFRKLHEVFIDIKSKNIDNINMNALSMGMTDDYEVAIEEGATYIRVGTGIFGKRN